MRCPFLREAQVKFCRASAYQKMIVRAPGGSADERCSSPDYPSCPAARQHLEDRPSPSHCPFLCESLVQYCSAAPVTKYVPYSESPATRCGSSGHRYCDVYLSLASPEANPLSWGDPESGRVEKADPPDGVGSLPMPEGLAWAPNHMWFDGAEDGTCHIGVDAFTTRVLGRVDRLSFPTTGGFDRPAVVLHVNGVDFPMIFPMTVSIRGVNRGLRSHPERLLEGPYRQGWLFEGHRSAADSGSSTSPEAGLLRGTKAAAWMREELERINRFVHDVLATPVQGGERFMADGGEAAGGLALMLDRDQRLRLYKEFFSPFAGRRGGS